MARKIEWVAGVLQVLPALVYTLVHPRFGHCSSCTCTFVPYGMRAALYLPPHDHASLRLQDEGRGGALTPPSLLDVLVLNAQVASRHSCVHIQILLYSPENINACRTLTRPPVGSLFSMFFPGSARAFPNSLFLSERRARSRGFAPRSPVFVPGDLLSLRSLCARGDGARIDHLDCGGKRKCSPCPCPPRLGAPSHDLDIAPHVFSLSWPLLRPRSSTGSTRALSSIVEARERAPRVSHVASPVCSAQGLRMRPPHRQMCILRTSREEDHSAPPPSNPLAVLSPHRRRSGLCLPCVLDSVTIDVPDIPQPCRGEFSYLRFVFPCGQPTIWLGVRALGHARKGHSGRQDNARDIGDSPPLPQRTKIQVRALSQQPAPSSCPCSPDPRAPPAVLSLPRFSSSKICLPVGAVEKGLGSFFCPRLVSHRGRAKILVRVRVAVPCQYRNSPRLWQLAWDVRNLQCRGRLATSPIWDATRAGSGG
ncbi:hypothetical protein B0H14DRAFT_3697155 [Mycena olivaceomarginata]|nr:hypothetical protein B0H14DRAFT_3697155 [Mycena olivaceomarginata]